MPLSLVQFSHLSQWLLPLAGASLPALPPPRNDLVILIPAVALISFVAAGFGFWAVRRMRFQHARADLLAENLHQMREDARRQLNFLNAISHDLRTPLNGITLQTHVMESALHASDLAIVRQSLGEVRTASGLAAEIIDALLQYARVDLDPNTVSRVRLAEVLAPAADPFRAAAEEKSLAFSFDVPEDLALNTDRDKLQRIVVNLLDNAVKFTPHGSVTLRAFPSEMPAAPNTLARFAGPTPAVTIQVIDTGRGIAPDECEKIFRPFFQANNPSRDARLGLGLGLVIAQRLAHHLHGTLSFESDPHHHTLFQLRLPQKFPDPLE